MDSIIEETSHYKIVVGKTVTTGNGNTCYQIVNKMFGVVEVESTLLPRILKQLSLIQADLDSLVDEKNATKH